MTPLPSVLLVDDDTTTNFLNQTLLTRLGVADRIYVALNGEQALTRVQAHCAVPDPECPALILLDVNMPGMNGIQFLEAYRQLPEVHQQASVVVMLTTSMHPRDVERVQQLHVDGFVSKPLTADKVQELLRTHFPERLNTAG
ncbi:response regulator [Hymenobacter latericus]|uniref:response regulator n=1 Tax=Hymenobacter sp. YIM 151858-1 TaxID=2987688 RepID=UPI002225FA03|nr:response regulator [Hymenobacter sp. YIM 151858-1]UYZ57898.1 response regulator [Hymenobacter sp. YIM 151858-1]